MGTGLSERGRATPPRYFYGIFLLALLPLAVLSAGCRRSAGASDITVREQISPQPVRTGLANIAIQLSDKNARPISHAKINVEGDMSHPGMAPAFGKAEETAPGSYQAHLNFNMGGDWVVLLHIRLADGRKLEKQFDVRGVQSN